MTIAGDESSAVWAVDVCEMVIAAFQNLGKINDDECSERNTAFKAQKMTSTKSRNAYGCSNVTTIQNKRKRIYTLEVQSIAVDI